MYVLSDLLVFHVKRPRNAIATVAMDLFVSVKLVANDSAFTGRYMKLSGENLYEF
jgi:hypothetical protein